MRILLFITVDWFLVDFFYWYMKTRVTKAGKLVPNPDNYDITDMRSDDSTDDDSRPKKTIPTWARSQSFFSFFFFLFNFFPSFIQI